jgi:hypothetical protein
MQTFLDIAIPVVVFFMMGVVGLELTIADFRHIAGRPGIVVASTLSQALLPPGIVVLLARFLNLGSTIEAGKKPGFGPMNAFSHMREYPPADTKVVVRPNFDTLHSVHLLDLTRKLMIVFVPDTNGRYYSRALGTTL